MVTCGKWRTTRFSMSVQKMTEGQPQRKSVFITITQHRLEIGKRVMRGGF
jgi:hypothetical protein